MDKKIRQQQIADWKRRPFSSSQYSSWVWNKEEWFQAYILNKRFEGNAETRFGSKIGKKLEKDPTFLPQIPRHSKMEQPFNAIISDIPLVGYADTFCDKTFKKLGEFKTGVAEWNQKRVDDAHQLTMYCLLNYITNKIPPEEVDIFLAWMPTQKKESGNFEVEINFVEQIEKNIKIFKTKRTMTDILKFANEIKKVVKLMEKYAKKHK